QHVAEPQLHLGHGLTCREVLIRKLGVSSISNILQVRLHDSVPKDLHSIRLPRALQPETETVVRPWSGCNRLGNETQCRRSEASGKATAVSALATHDHGLRRIARPDPTVESPTVILKPAVGQ